MLASATTSIEISQQDFATIIPGRPTFQPDIINALVMAKLNAEINKTELKIKILVSLPLWFAVGLTDGQPYGNFSGKEDLVSELRKKYNEQVAMMKSNAKKVKAKLCLYIVLQRSFDFSLFDFLSYGRVVVLT